MTILDHSKPYILYVDQVSFIRAGKTIIDKITLGLEKNGITGIIGASGAGKTSLLRLFNSLISPTTGNMFYNKANYTTYNPQHLRKQITLIQQQSNLFPGTVRENILYGPKIWGIAYSENEIQELLEKTALPENLLDKPINNLSGGEQQRVSIARSLANQPDIVLLDEPTSSLDVVSENVIEQTIQTMASQGVKIVIATHNLAQTQRLTDELLILQNGKLMERVATKQFYQNHTNEEINTYFDQQR